MVFKRGEKCKNWNGFKKGDIRTIKAGIKGGKRSTYAKAEGNAWKNWKHGKYSKFILKGQSTSEAVLRDLWGNKYEEIMEWERKWKESMDLWKWKNKYVK